MSDLVEKKKLNELVSTLQPRLTKGGRKTLRRYKPFRIEDAQSASPLSPITAHFVGGLNEKRCKSILKDMSAFRLST